MTQPHIEIPGLSPHESDELVSQIRQLWNLATPREDIARAVRLPRKLVDRIVSRLAAERQPIQPGLFHGQPQRDSLSER